MLVVLSQRSWLMTAHTPSDSTSLAWSCTSETYSGDRRIFITVGFEPVVITEVSTNDFKLTAITVGEGRFRTSSDEQM